MKLTDRLSLLTVGLPLLLLPIAMWAGCPSLPHRLGPSRIDDTVRYGLPSEAAGEAVYRLLIDPQPKLRNLLMGEEEWRRFVPLFCR